MGVRAILWQHLGPDGAPQFEDPNELLPTAPLAARIARESPSQQEALGAAYARLWARTFRTMVRHAQGHPERLLAVFAEEVLPYLLGRRVAARTERIGSERSQFLTDAELPIHYLAGMAAGFAALSGSEATPHVTGRDAFEIHHPLPAKVRAVRVVRHLSRLRIPLLLTSVLAAMVGIAAAGTGSWLDVTAILMGTLAAQSGANAVHDLRSRRPRHVLGAPRLSRPWLLFQGIGSYMVAGASLAWLLPGRPLLPAFAAAGFVLGGLYIRFKDQGWGPAIAFLSHGPVTVAGAAYALGLEPSLGLLAATVPTGALAAAMLYLDDLADSPLDQAAGSRTLVLRLAPARRFWAFAALLALALAGLAALQPNRILWLALVLLAGSAWLLSNDVRRHMDNPAGLTWARSGLLGHYTFTAATAAIILLRTP